MIKLLKPIFIGKHEITHPVFLAPMAGITDLPFRKLCKSLGAGMATTEMVNANSLLYGSEKTLMRASHVGETSPCSVQIAGACPDMLAEAAKFNVDAGADIIDINMGCPAKKVCNTLAGSALLRDEKLVAILLTAVVKAVNVPVTLKIRTGWSKELRNGVTIAKIAEDVGIQALAVHGRTRSCFFEGEAEYETIAAIKSQVKIPVIANGDINTPQKAQEVLLKTAVDGIMIGRAAQGRPWIFNEIIHYIDTNKFLAPLSINQIKDILLAHMHNLYLFYGEDKGVMIARKHVGWYSKGQLQGANFRKLFNEIKTAKEQLEAASLFFTQLEDIAA